MLDDLKNIKFNFGIYKKTVIIGVIAITILLFTYKFIYENRVNAKGSYELKYQNIKQQLKEAELKISEMDKLKTSSETDLQDEFVKKIKTSKIEQIPELLRSLTKDSIKLINIQPQEEQTVTFKNKNINSQKISIDMEMSFSTLVELVNKLKNVSILNKINSITTTREESISPFIKVNMVMILYSGEGLNI